MPNNKDNNVSLKGLRACKGAVSELVGRTAELAGCFNLLRELADAGRVPVDVDAIAECRSMLGVMNRLMCRQLAELKSMQLMGVMDRASEREAARVCGSVPSASADVSVFEGGEPWR